MLCGCVRLHDHNSPKPPSGARAGRWRSGRLQRCRFLAIALAKEEARTHLPRGDSVEHERVEVQAICRTGDTSCDDDAAPTPVLAASAAAAAAAAAADADSPLPCCLVALPLPFFDASGVPGSPAARV